MYSLSIIMSAYISSTFTFLVDTLFFIKSSITTSEDIDSKSDEHLLVFFHAINDPTYYNIH